MIYTALLREKKYIHKCFYTRFLFNQNHFLRLASDVENAVIMLDSIVINDRYVDMTWKLYIHV